MNWLTDDNIEFILKSSDWKLAIGSHTKLKSGFSMGVGDIEVRTDIANIYNAFFNAKNGLDTNEFVNDTKLTKKYTIFPIRVSGNHWGIFIIERGELSEKDQKQVEEIKTQTLFILDAWNNKSHGDEKKAVIKLVRILSDDNIHWVRQYDELTNLLRIYPNQDTKLYNLVRTWESIKDKFYNAYYTSSGLGVEGELKTIKPLIAGLTDDIIANNTNILAGQKQTDAYNCGVFLIFYIQEILETQKLELKRAYTSQNITDFRQEWKTRIGENKWCKEDEHGEEDVRGDDWSGLGINTEQKKEWFDENAPQGKKGFGVVWVEKLLNFGFKPDEGKFANWLKNKLENWGYHIGELTNFTNLIKDNLTNYRLEYQNLEKPPFSPPKPTKPKTPKKETPHDYSLNRNSQCQICAKRTFYSKAEFAQAHRGMVALEPSVWVYKEIYICKNPIITKQMWVCKVCKQEKHTDKCKYYSPPRPIIPIPEPFDWEGYWKWWFGTSTLDWESKRFFGSH